MARNEGQTHHSKQEQLNPPQLTVSLLLVIRHCIDIPKINYTTGTYIIMGEDKLLSLLIKADWT